MNRQTIGILSVLVLGILAPAAQAADTLQKVKEAGVLVAGVTDRVPQFGFEDPATGELAGYDVDLARAVARELGVRIKLRAVDPKSRVSDLVDGKVDLVAANLTRDPETGRVVDFSDVYLTTTIGFLTRKGTVANLQDLAGKKVAVPAESRMEQVMNASLPRAWPVPFDDEKKALRALRERAVDAGAGDTSLLQALLSRLPAGQFEIPPLQIAENPYVMGVRKGDERLLAAVNRALQDVRESGEAQEIYEKWFNRGQAAKAAVSARRAGGAIVRKAAAPPRVIVVTLRGAFVRGAEVAIHSASGDFVCKGKVTGVFFEQVYVDVDPEHYDEVGPGFAVAMNADKDAVREAISQSPNVLREVEERGKADEAAFAARREREGIEKEKRAEEADKKAYDSKLRVEENRATRDDYDHDHWGHWR